MNKLTPKGIFPNYFNSLRQKLSSDLTDFLEGTKSNRVLLISLELIDARIKRRMINDEIILDISLTVLLCIMQLCFDEKNNLSI